MSPPKNDETPQRNNRRNKPNPKNSNTQQIHKTTNNNIQNHNNTRRHNNRGNMMTTKPYAQQTTIEQAIQKIRRQQTYSQESNKLLKMEITFRPDGKVTMRDVVIPQPKPIREGLIV